MGLLDPLRGLKHRILSAWAEHSERCQRLGQLRPLQNPDLVEVPIFCISLAGERQRRACVRHQMEKLGFQKWSFFDAVDGRRLDKTLLERQGKYHGEEVRRRYGHDLTLGNIGCYLSHVEVMKDVVAQRIACALVVEDDVILEAGRIDDLKLLSLPPDWDIVFLHALYAHEPPENHVDHNFYSIASYGGSTAAYLISFQGALKLLKFAFPISWNVDGFLGTWMRDHVARQGLVDYRAYLVWPPCALNGSLVGTCKTTVKGI